MLPRADTYPPATARTLERHKHKQLPLAETTEIVNVTDSNYKHYYLPTTLLAYTVLQIWLATLSVTQQFKGEEEHSFLTHYLKRREKGLSMDNSKSARMVHHAAATIIRNKCKLCIKRLLNKYEQLKKQWS